jgi:hypothetical protein
MTMTTPDTTPPETTDPQHMTMGEFRELTADVPDDWRVMYVVREPDEEFRFYPADASVSETNRTVDIYDA